jgi:diguanylate cyclase (GGDEF)-like protein/PAS domain S-box-containing protein
MQIIYKHTTQEEADFTLNSILDISSDGFWDWNAITGYVSRSHGWFRMLGYDIGIFKNDVFSWEDVIHFDDYDRVMKHFESYINGEISEYKIEYRCKKFDDSYLWIEDSGKIVQKSDDGKVVRMIGVHRNIDEIKKTKDILLQQNKLLSTDKVSLENLVKERTEELNQINKKLQEQIKESEHNASHDSLTGLFNRRIFENLFEREIHRAKRYSYHLSVVLFDIDNFKKINDVHGHKFGDEILISIAILVQKCIRDSDIIARWGGEEFILILPETNLQDARDKAEKIRETIANEIFPNSIHVTCSFGATSFLKTDTADTLFIRCDDLLYKAKELGKNNVQEG